MAIVSPRRALKARMRRRRRVRARMEWFGDKVQNGIKIGMSKRLSIAGQLLRDMVVVNISKPVRKIRTGGGRQRGAGGQFVKTKKITVDPTSRSKPGEYPRADTTRLMKDIFFEKRGKQAVVVGTTLDYGLILETRMRRSFLRRTLNENHSRLTRILVQGTGNTTRFPGEE